MFTDSDFQNKHTPPCESEEPQQNISEVFDDDDDSHNREISVTPSGQQSNSDEIAEKIKKLEESATQVQEEQLASGKAIKGLKEMMEKLEHSMGKIQEELTTEKKQNAELKEKMKKMEENTAKMQAELTAEKEISSHLKTTVIPGLLERIDNLENSLQFLEWTWVIPRDDVNLSGKILGAGGWGSVHEATYRGRKVAAKCLHHAIMSQYNKEKFEKEMRMSAICKHSNLVEFIGAVMEEPAIILIELMDKTLRDALIGKDITQDNNKSVYMDVARGLQYLHSLRPYPVIHRDISAPNVLLKAVNHEKGGTVNWIAKLSDFGSAQFAHLAQTPGPGCILYSAPEVRSEEPAQQTVKIDIYSFGVLLAEILTTDMPHDSLRIFLKKACEQKPQFSSLILRCTDHNPDQRPFISDVITQLQIIN